MSQARAPRIAITGVGLRCSLGQNVVQSCASVRAGISRFGTWPAPPPEGGATPDDPEPVEVAAAAVLPDLGDRSWLEKFDALATQPLFEALWMAGLPSLVEEGCATKWAMRLVVPPLDRAGVDEEDATAFAEDVQEGTLFDVEVPALSPLCGGNAGVLVALAQAAADFEKGAVEVCVLGGVDSLLHTPYLDDLDTEGRLKTTATPVGIIPGEAAAFVVLETVAHARARQAPVLAQVTPVRTAVERESPRGKEPGRGEAMARALRQAVADAPSGPGQVHRVINDLNGERWRFLEWALASNPALAGLPPDFRFWHPADSFGEIGAATGAAHLCLAVRAFARSYAVGDAILISNASDTGERAALCVCPADERS